MNALKTEFATRLSLYREKKKQFGKKKILFIS